MSRNTVDGVLSEAYLGREKALCHPPTPGSLLLTLSFSKKEQWCQVNEICQTFLMVFVAYGQGRIQGARKRGMPTPIGHFRKCFSCMQFFHNFEPFR